MCLNNGYGHYMVFVVSVTTLFHLQPSLRQKIMVKAFSVVCVCYE